jgi:multidrug efflux pump
MSLASVSINRPVFATVLSLVLVLFGWIGFRSLGVREYPVIDPPIVTVTTNYRGANADIIESQITEVLEESINGIEGIRTLTSTSADGRSTITIEFQLERDLDAAANDVRDRVSRSIRNLPVDADPPVVAKSDADSSPILILTLQSSERDLLSLNKLANDLFKERLQTVPGVSSVFVFGEKRYSMKLQFDPLRMSAHQITAADIRTALERQNVELPSGRIEGYRNELSIRTLGRLTTEADFDNLVLAERGGHLVRLIDVGKARLRPENERLILYGNGVIPMVGLGIAPLPGANYITIADQVYERLGRIQQDMPKDIILNLVQDNTLSIRKAIEEVNETIFIAFGLVVIVIYFFLLDWRTTLIPTIAIPISLIASFFILYLFGFSINVLTLLGIVLATGLVVDDAIVVLENIYRKIEHGMDPIEAGHEGSREIVFAVLSTTLTLIAVFLPVVFLSGTTGRLFREFGVVVGGSVLVSGLVSLTLTPMMCARLLRKPGKRLWILQKIENGLTALENGYARWLGRIVRQWWLALGLVLLCVGLFIGLGRELKSELAPLEDKGRLQMFATAPEGISFELMNQHMLRLAQLVDTLPEKQAFVTVVAPTFGAGVGVNTGFVRMGLQDAALRKRSQQEIADELQAEVQKHTFARTFVVQEQTIQIGLRAGLPIEFVLQATDLDKLKTYLPRFLEKAQASPVFQSVDYDLKFNKPELNVEIDREKAQTLGIDVLDIAQTLQLLFAEQRYGYYIQDGKQYQVIGQADRLNRSRPDDLTGLYVRNKKGVLIQLSDLVRLTPRATPPQLYRFNRFVSATVKAAPAKGYTLGNGVDEMRRIAKETLDPSFQTALSGTAREYAESNSSLLFAFILALALVYLILAAQFESFIDPFIIMLTVPLALAGAVLSLWLMGQTLNIFSQIGMIVLVGLVTKNAILIVEFANQEMAAGKARVAAVVEAARSRLRPILMTSLTAVLGALPIAASLGASSTSRKPLGTVIVGGLSFALLLTLVVIPMLFLIISRRQTVGQAVATSSPESGRIAHEESQADALSGSVQQAVS